MNDNPLMLKKYAHLLVHYSLYLKKGEKLFIKSTLLAAPLIEEIFLEATKVGAIVETSLDLPYQSDILLTHGDDDQLDHTPILQEKCMSTFDAYLAIRAPYPSNDIQHTQKDKAKSGRRTKALKPIHHAYFTRLGDGSMKRSLCQYPTQFNADLAGMSLTEYEKFIFEACNLYSDDPAAEWEKLSASQQKIADLMNGLDKIRYKNKHTDIICEVKGRTWINSDGKTNMPSGEVFTSPVENSVNGYIHFDFPSIYSNHEVKGITLHVKDGEVYDWDAEIGKDFLDKIFKIKGARFFGEVAVGNNYNIKRATKNILFDEKIGGTVHMAIGQSYIQAGGKNESSIHWDMIADMKDGGEIYGDGKLIYKNGKYI